MTAHHVNHRIRAKADADALSAAELASRLGVAFELHTMTVEPGPNLEARARAARYGVLPPGVMTGHTADDQAETLLLNLIRGAGADGLAAMTPGHRRPILALRRSETHELCAELGVQPLHDETNDSPSFRRNRVRDELVPLAGQIAERDIAPILARTATILRAEGAFLDGLASAIDPSDAKAVAAADPVLARRALRRWLTVDGYPPDAAAIERVRAVASGEHVACELPGGVRVERSHQRLRIVASSG